jgi:hypothetical protein
MISVDDGFTEQHLVGAARLRAAGGGSRHRRFGPIGRSDGPSFRRVTSARQREIAPMPQCRQAGSNEKAAHWRLTQGNDRDVCERRQHGFSVDGISYGTSLNNFNDLRQPTNLRAWSSHFFGRASEPLVVDLKLVGRQATLFCGVSIKPNKVARGTPRTAAPPRCRPAGACGRAHCG